MGLLDALFSPDSYNGGPSGGLLDLIRQQSQYQPSPGFSGPQSSPLDNAQWPAGPNGAPSSAASPLAVGGYQMPRIGNMAQFTPPPADPAVLPQNAQPTQGQMPDVQSKLSPALGGGGYMDRLNNGGGLISSLFGDSGQQQNNRALFDAYKGAGLTPQQAYLAVLNPHAATNFLGGGQTDDIKEYQFAKKEDPSLTFDKFMAKKKSVNGEYSLKPEYGTNDKGETVLIQTGKSGEAIQTKLPEGVKISSGVDKIDLGTSWGIVDKRTGNLIGQQPKDIKGKESAEEVGKAQGLAQVALPNALAQADLSLGVIDKALKHPGLDRSTGIYGKITSFPGSDAYNFDRVVEQVKGKAFLQAFESLKGAGAITDVEGKKATDAIARLDQAQSKEAFVESLNELKGIIEAGKERARARAGGAAAPAAAAPTTDLKKKYGLD